MEETIVIIGCMGASGFILLVAYDHIRWQYKTRKKEFKNLKKD